MILLAVLLLLSIEPKPSVDCEMVRAKVKEIGRLEAYALAIANGYSPKEISRIRKMCGV